MVKRYDQACAADGTPLKMDAGALVRSGQNYSEAGAFLGSREGDDDYGYALVKYRLGRHNQVVRSLPIHRQTNIRFYDAAQRVLDDGRGTSHPIDDKNGLRPAGVASSSTSTYQYLARRPNRTVLSFTEDNDGIEEPGRNAQLYSQDLDSGDEDDTPIPEVTPMQSFWMHEEDKVKAYLIDRIECLQQLSDKRIAKAWIKAICPRKQAFFPYQTKKRKEEGDDQVKPNPPGWWPEEEVCPFREPDHVIKHQRNALMLHLLRLRPTQDELKAMNGNIGEPLEYYGDWTAFLKDAAPAGEKTCILNSLEPSNEDRKKRRRNLLREIYEIAAMEEAYLTEGPDVQYQYELEVKIQKPVTGKRARRAASVSSSQDADGDETDTRSVYAGRGRKAMKARRRRSVARSPSHPPTFVDEKPTVEEDYPVDLLTPDSVETAVASSEEQRMKTDIIGDIKAMRVRAPAAAVPASTRLHRAATGQLPAHFQPTSHHEAIAMHGQPDIDMQYWPLAHVSPNTSFNPTSTEQATAYEAYMGGHPHFPGQHDPGHTPYPTPQYHHHSVQVHRVNTIPQPQIDTVPNTPTFSTMDWMVPSAAQEQQPAVGPPVNMAYTMAQPWLQQGTNGYCYDQHEAQHASHARSMQQITHGMPAIHTNLRNTHVGGGPPVYDAQMDAIQYPPPMYAPF